MVPRGQPSTVDYLSLPQVAARIHEFCGLTPGERSRCVYVAGMGAGEGPHAHWGRVAMRPPATLTDLLRAGDDVARSMWDTESLLVHVDVDYVNAAFLGEAFIHPADSFLKLEAAYRGLWEVFDEVGMPMLDLMTGAGYNFVGRVPLESAAAVRLASRISEVPAWLPMHARHRPSWAGTSIDENHAKAHRGLGLVLEHLAHRVLSRAASASPIPLVLDNTEVGVGWVGRECASIDLTQMGDPLDARHVRVAFGLYQKHRLRPDIVGDVAARVPPLAVVPRRRRSLLDILEHGRGLREAAEEAGQASAAIPDVAAGLLRLLDDYSASDLARWHEEFYAVRPHPPEDWSRTYGRFDPSGLPPCVAACLERPNDLLLKPTHLQLLVRTLLARGWQARHVAGLVRAHYARSDVWGEHWERVDPATRADFDVRVFAGLVATGRDEGIDFNCVSTQEKGMCPARGCSFDLRRERDRLLAGSRS